MRRLVLSDVHANATALAAALAACQGLWDQAVCLGDLVGYGPDPNEVIDQVRPLVAAIIRGNHDKAVSGLGRSGGLQSGGPFRGGVDSPAAPSGKSAVSGGTARRAASRLTA